MASPFASVEQGADEEWRRCEFEAESVLSARRNYVENKNVKMSLVAPFAS